MTNTTASRREGEAKRLFDGYHEDIERTCLFDWIDASGRFGFTEIAFKELTVPFGSVSREIQPTAPTKDQGEKP